MFKKENRKFTIALISTLTATTIIYILYALGLFVSTEMPWYQSLTGLVEIISSYAFFYELGKRKNENKH